MRREARGGGGVFLGCFWDAGSLGWRMPGSQSGAGAAGASRSSGEDAAPTAAKWGCRAGGAAGPLPSARGVIPVAGLCSRPPAAGVTVTGGASPHPAAEDSPAAMRWLECRSCRCPPRPRPAASGGGRWPGRCCQGTRGLQGDSGTGGGGHGGAMGLRARTGRGLPVEGLGVCARVCVCMYEHA